MSAHDQKLRKLRQMAQEAKRERRDSVQLAREERERSEAAAAAMAIAITEAETARRERDEVLIDNDVLVRKNEQLRLENLRLEREVERIARDLDLALGRKVDRSTDAIKQGIQELDFRLRQAGKKIEQLAAEIERNSPLRTLMSMAATVSPDLLEDLKFNTGAPEPLPEPDLQPDHAAAPEHAESEPAQPEPIEASLS